MGRFVSPWFESPWASRRHTLGSWRETTVRDRGFAVWPGYRQQQHFMAVTGKSAKCFIKHRRRGAVSARALTRRRCGRGGLAVAWPWWPAAALFQRGHPPPARHVVARTCQVKCRVQLLRLAGGSTAPFPPPVPVPGRPTPAPTHDGS